MTDVVLVHGAWHGGWCWEHTAERLEAAGHRPHTFDLPDHDEPGDRSRTFASTASYLDAVSAAVDRFDDPIVVGHSMGGYLVQRLRETRRLRLAVLVASVPHTGAMRANLRALRNHPRAMLMSTLTLDYRHPVASERLIRELFFTDATPDETVEHAHRMAQNESPRAMLAMMARPPRPSKGGSPVRVIAAREDDIFTLAEQDALAQAYGTEAIVLDGGHDIMLDTSRDIFADTLISIVREAAEPT